MAEPTYANLDEFQLSILSGRFRACGGDNEVKITQSQFFHLVESETEFVQTRLFSLISQGDGFVTCHGFQVFVNRYALRGYRPKAEFLFDLYDLDGDGYLSGDEMKEMLRQNVLASQNSSEYTYTQNGAFEAEVDEREIDELLTDMLERLPLSSSPENVKLNKRDFLNLFDGHEDLLLSCKTVIQTWLGPALYRKSLAVVGIYTAKRFSRYKNWVLNNPLFLTWLIIYAVANLLVLAAGVLRYTKVKKESMWHALGRGTGFCIEFNCGFILLTMMRHLLAKLKCTRLAHYLIFDDSRYFHMLAGRAIVFWSICHMTAHLVNVKQRIESDSVGGWNYEEILFVMDATGQFGLIHGFSYLSGFILVLIIVGMYLCALAYVRRNGGFRIFYVSHILGYVLFYVLAILHAKQFWHWTVGPLALYLAEQIIRMYNSYFGHRTIINEGKILASRVTKLVLTRPKMFKFYPGDYAFIKIPHFSKYEWHALSISSPPENDDEMTFHVKAMGKWSDQIYAYYSQNSMQTLWKNRPDLINNNNNDRDDKCHSNNPLTILLDGPYRAPASNIFVAEHAVLIAAGIGITPFASILKSIINQHWNSRTQEQKDGMTSLNFNSLRRVDFIWTNRELNSFNWFHKLLEDLESEQEVLAGACGDKILNIQMYNTTTLQNLEMKSIMLQLAYAIQNEKSKESSSVPGKLKNQINFGRPKWEKIFNELRGGKDGKVTVFFCGPRILGRKLNKLCLKYGFAFRMEKF